jgi:hypothetical protein
VSGTSNNNRWECKIDGVEYSGTVDTSFYQLIHTDDPHPDTVIYCNGTSDDKGANIHFNIIVNRTYSPGPIKSSAYNGLLALDTVSTRFLIAAGSFNGSEVTYIIDTLSGNKLGATFSGELILPLDIGLNGGSIHSVTDGKFNCEFGVGDSEPKTFSFANGASKSAGYFSSASIISNTLEMDGLTYNNFGYETFKLLVRTGGTIKPGIYKSKNGDVGLQAITPGIDPFYVNDSLGDLTVTINSVNGNVVTGVFSGMNKDSTSISGGKFSCRVRNYVPQVDSVNKWDFSEDEPVFLYRMFGGNILTATKSELSGRSYLSIVGESDNEDSQFQLVISSNSAIAPGIYKTGSYTNALNSLYFKSNTKIWNGNTTYLYADDSYPAYCRIDSIDSQKVVGTLYGHINISLSSAGKTGAEIKKGRFRASF